VRGCAGPDVGGAVMNALTSTTKIDPAAVPAEPSLSDLTAKIKEDHKGLRESMKYMVTRAWGIGFDLIEVKKIVGHGKFGKYIKDNCDITDKTAERYMKLAENKTALEAKLVELGDKFESISNLL
jgi:hypothetical protein